MEPVSVGQSLTGLGSFLLYFVSSLVFLVLFKWLYPLITPHKEWQLVREERNTAAAVAMAGAYVGFSIALGSAASHSVAYLDFVIWAVVALLAQGVAYVIANIVLSGVSQRIKNQELSAGVIAGGTSVAVGILNAACMTY